MSIISKNYGKNAINILSYLWESFIVNNILQNTQKQRESISPSHKSVKMLIFALLWLKVFDTQHTQHT